MFTYTSNKRLTVAYRSAPSLEHGEREKAISESSLRLIGRNLAITWNTSSVSKKDETTMAKFGMGGVVSVSLLEKTDSHWTRLVADLEVTDKTTGTYGLFLFPRLAGWNTGNASGKIHDISKNNSTVSTKITMSE